MCPFQRLKWPELRTVNSMQLKTSDLWNFGKTNILMFCGEFFHQPSLNQVAPPTGFLKYILDMKLPLWLSWRNPSYRYVRAWFLDMTSPLDNWLFCESTTSCSLSTILYRLARPSPRRPFDSTLKQYLKSCFRRNVFCFKTLMSDLRELIAGLVKYRWVECFFSTNLNLFRWIWAAQIKSKDSRLF
jgi:hypothetical protein